MVQKLIFITMNIRIYIYKFLFVLYVVLAGCAPGKHALEDTNLQLPDHYQAEYESRDTSTWALVNWNQFFKDEQLKKLIQQGLDNNQDVLKSLYSIQLAQADLRYAKLGRLPELNAYAGTAIRRFGEYTMDGVGNTDSNLSPTVPEDKKIPDPYKDFMLGLDFNWEIDIWGKLKMKRKRALARYLESEEMYNFARTSLIATIAETYYLISGLEEEIGILEKNIEVQEEAFDLGKSLKETGQDSQLSLDQFEGLLLNSKGLLLHKKKLLQNANLTMHQLTGTYQLEIDAASLSETEQLPEVIEIGLPADLLSMRPDIRAAERNLEANRLQVGIARTAFFPSLNLTGLVGFNAFDFSRLFLAPASSVYQLGGNLAAPIFNRNRIKAYYEASRADQKIALLDYEQTVLKSYLEVLSLVNDFKYLGDQITLKAEEVTIQKRSIENSSIMFRVGYANYLDVINSQSRSLESELAFVQLRVEQLQSYVNLYRALGGGWL